MAKRMKSFCEACGEPTTHELRTIEGKDVYVCLMCEAGRSRPKEAVERIKKTRKGWRSL
jgi:hypothetical protein